MIPTVVVPQAGHHDRRAQTRKAHSYNYDGTCRRGRRSSRSAAPRRAHQCWAEGLTHAASEAGIARVIVGDTLKALGLNSMANQAVVHGSTIAIDRALTRNAANPASSPGRAPVRTCQVPQPTSDLGERGPNGL